MKRRFHELDSLRGLAALSVVIGHCFGVLPAMAATSPDSHRPILTLLKFTPLSFVIDGSSAVILFFVLSGFVLSLPFHSGHAPPYRQFLVRRIFRLYVPYLAALGFAVTVRSFIRYHSHKNLSSWFNAQWHSPVRLDQILAHLTFLPDYTFGGGRYDIAAFDSVIWSLVQEMRISIIFPLLMLLVIRLSWKTNAAIAVLCSLLYAAITSVGQHLALPSLFVHLISLLNTLEFIPMFIVGALLAAHFNSLTRRIREAGLGIKLSLAIGGLFAYTASSWIPTNVRILHLSVIQDWLTLSGGSAFILLALSLPRLSRILQLKPVYYLGQRSYSLYLFHLVILVALVQLFFGRTPLWAIWSITVALSVAIASLAYRYVELPSIRLGKRITAMEATIDPLGSSAKARI